MTQFKHNFFLVILLVGVNYSYAQQHVEVPTPEYKDWPCFYIEGKTETWNLERHSAIYQALGGNVLKMEYKVLLSSAMKYTLEGKISGVVIKSTDAFTFLLRLNTAEFKSEFELAKQVAENLKEQFNWSQSEVENYLKEEEAKIILKYECKLYRLKVEGESRAFRDDDKQISCSFEKIGDNIVKINPTTKLKKGEYAFFYKDFFAFTFRIVD